MIFAEIQEFEELIDYCIEIAEKTNYELKLFVEDNNAVRYFRVTINHRYANPFIGNLILSYFNFKKYCVWIDVINGVNCLTSTIAIPLSIYEVYK